MAETSVILIVDDEPDVREVLAEYLGAHGYATIGAENAGAARAIAVQSAFDLALVDIHMPARTASPSRAICANAIAASASSCSRRPVPWSTASSDSRSARTTTSRSRSIRAS